MPSFCSGNLSFGVGALHPTPPPSILLVMHDTCRKMSDFFVVMINTACTNWLNRNRKQQHIFVKANTIIRVFIIQHFKCKLSVNPCRMTGFSRFIITHEPTFTWLEVIEVNLLNKGDSTAALQELNSPLQEDPSEFPSKHFETLFWLTASQW